MPLPYWLAAMNFVDEPCIWLVTGSFPTLLDTHLPFLLVIYLLYVLTPDSSSLHLPVSHFLRQLNHTSS